MRNLLKILLPGLGLIAIVAALYRNASDPLVQSSTPVPFQSPTNASIPPAPRIVEAPSALRSQPAPPRPAEMALASVPVPVAPALEPGNEASTVPEKDQLLLALREWATRDAEQALKSVLKLPEGEERDEALEAVCFGIAEKDPAVALDAALALHLDKRPGVVENLAQHWAETDLASALAWANDQPPGKQRDDVLARVAFIQSQSAPADAARLVTEQIPFGTTQDEAVMMVLHQWVIRDMKAAVQWVTLFPEGPLRDRAIAELDGILNEHGI